MMLGLIVLFFVGYGELSEEFELCNKSTPRKPPSLVCLVLQLL